ncbi:MAG TPA: N-acetylneuraminate synthase family protein [Spirochaetales bacterium]|nr:N-acetylneuraminate synthase family protein [Spirochaetales bacterium]
MSGNVFDRVLNAAGEALIIAELGTGHGGDELKAMELAAAAVEAGADCVKLQHVYADEIIHPETGLVPLPGGLTRLYDRFLAVETGPDFIGRVKDRVESLGAEFLCTPFGLRSARELRELGVRAMKVASPELNHLPLLDELASYGLPTILSSGVSTLADIELALSRFHGVRTALLHCVTAYPAPEADYNLRLLPALSALFGLPVGVSDHSSDPILVPAVAVALGAAIIEKHFCLSRSDDGLDDPIALPPAEFAAMASAIRARPSLDGLRAEYGSARVEATLGDGVKRLAPSERANYTRTNRSIHAKRRIRAGERLGDDNLSILRTEKVLRPGLEPRLWEAVIGRVAARDVPDGEGLEWADIGGAWIGS